MKETFQPKNFSPAHQRIIYHANDIIEEYQAQGFTLTLRQLYYQFVSRDLIPNTPRDYKNLGVIISLARLAGEIDWDAIEDRGRNLNKPMTFINPAERIQVAAYNYQLNPWLLQDNYVEVWVEKEALIGVIEGVCRELRVPYFACKGYTSQSEMYSAGKRLLSKIEDGKKATIIHLGDHDPSGMDMTRDVNDRLVQFAGIPQYEDLKVRRIALNTDQVKQYAPPPNPAKLTDTRATKYIKQFGNKSWELDALSPEVISTLIRKHISGFIDEKRWAKSQAQEKKDLKVLNQIAKDLQ